MMGVWFEKERDADVSRGSTLNGLPEGRDTVTQTTNSNTKDCLL